MIGIDIVKISRIENLIKKFKNNATDRFLSKKEAKLSKSPNSIAGFFAAKEAASKAIGTGIGKNCSFKDIKISKSKQGRPKLKYKKSIRDRYNIKKSNLSISHDGGFAIAVVVNEYR